MEDITLDSLEPLASKSAAVKASSSFSLHRKRKLIIDSKIEISSEAMRAGLEQDGPDDITRQPCVSFAKKKTFMSPFAPGSRIYGMCSETMALVVLPAVWLCPHFCGSVVPEVQRLLAPGHATRSGSPLPLCWNGLGSPPT